MTYVVTFGKHKQKTKHEFSSRRDALNKAKSLRKNLPGIGFAVKKKK